MTSKKLTVADLFCGAGGFSEGFRRRGFDIIFAIDNWRHAADTFRFNHPQARVVQMDILGLEVDKIDELIPDTDVIIGSPPCTFFSRSNRGGKGDSEEGMELVKKFLQIVAIKKPRYWVLENVPTLDRHLKKTYTYRELGIGEDGGGILEIPMKRLLDSADFGVPQRRIRLFAGDFPEVEGPESPPLTLGQAIGKLPDPATGGGRRRMIKDPNYSFEFDPTDLTDHFYDTRISNREVQDARRLKTDHSFYGRMSFPEDTNRPSRTVTAVKTTGSRESMIFGYVDMVTGRKAYRSPTVREAATLQSFPLDYQFLGASEWTKWKLVGNSVPAKVSSAIADAILADQGIEADEPAIIKERLAGIPFDLNGKSISKRSTSGWHTPRFRRHVPNMKIRGFRVDLDNLSSSFDKEEYKWRVTLHHGTGAGRARKAYPTTGEARKLLDSFEPTWVDGFLKDLETNIIPRIPNPGTFQAIYSRGIRANGFLGPWEALSVARTLVNRYVRKGTAYRSQTGPILAEVGERAIPVKIAAVLYAMKRVEDTVREGKKVGR